MISSLCAQMHSCANVCLNTPVGKKMLALSRTIEQIAFTLFFVAGSIFSAAALFPLHFHAALIPLAALSSTFLASFFFPSAPLYMAESTRTVPTERPRGLTNISQNCAFNSLVHLLESDPQIAHWLRHPLQDNIHIADFERFLASYELPLPIVADFRAFVNGQNPMRPLPILFEEFAEGYRPAEGISPVFQEFKQTYRDLRRVHPTLSQFLSAYDEAVRTNRPTVGRANTQSLRIAVSDISAMIPPSPYEQIDAVEPMSSLLALLPPALKMKISEVYEFHVGNLPPLQGIPTGRTVPQVKSFSHFPLCIPPDTFRTELGELITFNFNEELAALEKRSIDGVNRSYPATIQREFVEFPPALRFQIKRFESKPPLFSWLTWLGCSQWPFIGQRSVKRETLVSAPQEMAITLANGDRRNYRLQSFINHFGGYGSGHYTACRQINGNRYYMSDQEVRLLSEAQWGELLERAYIVSYLPM